MTIKSLKPSLAFNGSCARAIALYERAFGAETTALVRFADGAKMGHAFDASYGDRVLNATLRIGQSEIMVMDTTPSRPVPTDTNVSVFVDFDSVAALEKSFATLAEGGTVTMPVTNSFWGSRFGMVQDAYGIRWMLSHELRKQ